jgi:alpha-glucosidase
LSSSWWTEAVVYEAYVRSFGDLPSLRARLPYVRDLGVDAIWLTPFYPTADYDAGYDVIDHRAVDPRLGTLSDVDNVIKDAHVYGLKVVVDLVLNHVSSAHPWFRAARSGGPERERFHITRTPNDWQSLFGGSAWERLDQEAWYLHTFHREQPDLNFANSEVLADADATLQFWLDRGVDGVRFDAAGSLWKDPARGHSNLPEVHDLYRRWASRLGDRLSIAETWGGPEILAPYLQELDQAFAMEPIFWPLDAAVWRKGIDELLAVTPRPTWVHGSHDVARAATRWGPDGSRAVLMLMLALPGAVYVYSGDELGLVQARTDDPDPRSGARQPMPWAEAERQLAEPASALAWIRRVIRNRPFAGELTWLEAPSTGLAFRRGSSICVVNFGTDALRCYGVEVEACGAAWVSSEDANGLGIESSSSRV